MPEPAFLVEGLMEQRIIQQLCPGKPARLIGANGKDVPISVIARFISKQVNAGLYGRYFPIIIIFDREGRLEKPDNIIKSLKSEIKKIGLDVQQFRFGVADRMIENWILADRSRAFQGYDVKISNAEFEGSNGSSQIKKILKNQDIYHKPTLGAEMFLRCRPEVMKNNSPSFSSFIDNCDFDCWWVP